MKKEIIKLRKEGKTYKEICEIVGCAKSTVSYHCKNNNLAGNIKPKRTLEYLCSDKYKKILEDRAKYYKERIMKEDFNNLSFQRLRKRVGYEQDGKCFFCKNSEWLGKPIILELDHIDGDNTNNKRNNLRCLCPNCHSTTPTWRGKNKKTLRNKISDDILLNCIIKNNFNFRQSLLELGLSAKGGNYKRCHKLKNEYLAD